ncbi:hypothetical protein [Sphingobium sp. Leaf26]|uniref:hypothetical protein n=1 Tax=Sphingobium sp. Leaf26 TaxID=1735693 RepID=UPI000B33FA9C|nr:hypothetical protein [Sphingobium sp. Leaf26]
MAVRSIKTTRRLTDTQLVSTQFRYFDPENSIVGLNPGVPDPEARPTIIGYYDETPPGGMKANPEYPFVRCCHCGHRRHWIGRVIHDDRGETYIIGARGCGRDHYGVRYSDAEKAFKQEQERRNALIRWANMLKLVPVYRAELAQLLQSPALAALELKRDEIKRTSPEGFRKLVQIANTAQLMFETRKLRDHEAEQKRQVKFERAMIAYNALPIVERRRRRNDGLKPEADDTPIYKRTLTPLGVLVGGDFLTERGDARKFALELRATLDEIDLLQKAGTDTAATSNLTRLLREMTDRPRSLDEALGDTSFTPVFFQKENLERISRWSTGEARFTYSREGLDLIVQDMSKGQARIKPLESLDLPRLDGLQASRYIDDDFLPMMVDAA